MKQCHFKTFTPESKWIFILVELNQLQQTGNVLLSLKDEKMPSKIKIFPSRAPTTRHLQHSATDKRLKQQVTLWMFVNRNVRQSGTLIKYDEFILKTFRNQTSVMKLFPCMTERFQRASVFTMTRKHGRETPLYTSYDFATIEILQRIIIRILDKCSMNILLLTSGRRGNLDREAKLKKQEET